MSVKKKSLPPIFWILILVALAVLIMLIIGLIQENRERISAFLSKTGVTSSTKEEGVKQEESSPVPVSKSNCKQSAPTVIFPDEKNRLVGWSIDPKELAVWVLKPGGSQLKRLSIEPEVESVISRELSHVSLLCEKQQAPHCFVPQYTGQTLEDMELQGSEGWARFSATAGTTRPTALVRMSSDGLRFRQRIGACGADMSLHASLLWTEDNGQPVMMAYSSTQPFVYFYSNYDQGVFSLVEVPRPPAQTWQITAQGLEPASCTSSSDYSVQSASLSKTHLALLSQGKGVSAEKTVWVYSRNGDSWEPKIELKPKDFGGAIASVNWFDEKYLIVSLANFFRTNTKNILLPLDTGKEMAPMTWNEVYGESILSRESQLPGNERNLAYLSWANKDTSALLRWNSEAFFKFSESIERDLSPRVLWSNRGQGKYLVIYQEQPESPIKAVQIFCSTKN
jgi:hypothetical protein